MAYRLIGAKPFSKPMMTYRQMNTEKQISEKFKSIFYNIFIEENAFKNVVCEKLAILSRPWCVNS